MFFESQLTMQRFSSSLKILGLIDFGLMNGSLKCMGEKLVQNKLIRGMSSEVHNNQL